VDRAIAGGDGPDDSLDREAVYDVATMTRDLGARWEVQHTYLKPYAACRYAHAAIDACLELIGDTPPKEKDIAALSVEVFPEVFTITNERAPTTLEGAQFSVPFSVALAVLRGAKAFRPMREDTLRDDEVLALAARVEMVTGVDFATAFPRITPSRVHLSTAGTMTTSTVICPLGDVDNPLSWNAVEEKLRDLGAHLSNEVVARLCEGCRRLADGDALPLLRILSDAGTTASETGIQMI
jgi:2-methylcitrate dehydratase PrpD